MIITNDNIDRLNELTPIVKGIAYRNAYKFTRFDVEDLIQEIWINVLKEESKHIEPLDLNLVAVIGFRTISRLLRYEKIRSNVIPVEDPVEFNPQTYNENEDVLDDQLLLKKLFQLYPQDTKEGTYLRYLATKANIADFGFRPNSTYKDGFTDGELAKILGYTGTHHSGYQKLKKEIKQILLDYFNYNLDDESNL